MNGSNFSRSFFLFFEHVHEQEEVFMNSSWTCSNFNTEFEQNLNKLNLNKFMNMFIYKLNLLMNFWWTVVEVLKEHMEHKKIKEKKKKWKFFSTVRDTRRGKQGEESSEGGSRKSRRWGGNLSKCWMNYVSLLKSCESLMDWLFFLSQIVKVPLSTVSLKSKKRICGWHRKKKCSTRLLRRVSLHELFMNMNSSWTCSNFCGEYLNNCKFNMFVKTKKFELNPLVNSLFASFYLTFQYKEGCFMDFEKTEQREIWYNSSKVWWRKKKRAEKKRADFSNLNWTFSRLDVLRLF